MRLRFSTYLNRQTSSSSIINLVPKDESNNNNYNCKKATDKLDSIVSQREAQVEEVCFETAMAFDEVSSPVLAYKFSSQDFDPEKYIKGLVSTSDIKRTLVEHHNRIQILSDETAVSMKKNVYRNYRQFIDTSKEISYLEAEMYQLSHMLTEHKALINNQVEMNIFGSDKEKEGTIEDAVEKGQNKRGVKLSELIAGCQETVANRRSNDIIHQGSLTGIDPDSYSAISKVELFFLQDYLLIAFKEFQIDSSKKYKFNTMFDLNDVAIVNVRDGGGVRHCFKILNGLDIWMFGAENREAKLHWLEILQDAKKNYKKIEYIPPSPQVQKRKAPKPPTDELKAEEKKPTEPINQFPDLLNVDWLIELPDDLDMCIAQRSFDAAVKLVEKATSYLHDFPETTALKEYKERINSRVKQLIEAIEISLDNSTTMRHISLRSIRQYSSLLIRLGRAKLACELFLRNRGFAVKHSFRQLKIEGSTSLYITKLANVFFTSVVETGKEFRRIFTKSSSVSAFVVWAHKELLHFVSLFARQVFSRKSSLAAIAVCIEIALDHCQKLLSISLDLRFDMQHMFLKHLMEALFDNRDQLIGKAKHLGAEETWTPIDFSANTDDIYTTIGELESLGIQNVYSLATGSHQFLLSKSTIGFTKGVLIYFEDCMKLYSPQLHNVFVQCLTEIFKTQALQLEFTIKSDKFKEQLNFILSSTKFIFDSVLPIIEGRLKEKVGHPLESLRQLHDELPRLEKIASLRQKRTKQSSRRNAKARISKLCIDLEVQKRKAPKPPTDELKAEEMKPTEPINQFPDLLNVDWLIELPDDLDMCIAQRSFDAAVKLVEKATGYLHDFPETTALKEYKERINSRVKQLIEAIEISLDNSTTMRHISLRSIRQYSSLLIRLGRAKLACELFLRNRGFAVKHSFRQLKIEGSTSLYITKLANVFFTSVVETGKEFRRIFTKSSSVSAFVVWAHKELLHFVSLFARQVFSRKSSLAAIAVCIEIALDHCQKLLSISLDLRFDMQHMFLKHLMEALFDNRDQLIGKAKHLGAEETWTPIDFSANTDDIYTTIGELESLGIQNVYSLATGSHQFLLSKSTIGFTKGVLIYFEDCMKLYSPQLHNVFVQCLTEIFKTQALQLEFTIKSDKFKEQLNFILSSTKFIFDSVLPIIEGRLKEKVGHPLESLRQLHDELPRLEKIASLRQKRT